MGADDRIMLIQTKISVDHALKTLIKMQFPFPGNITVMDMILMVPATSWRTPFIRDRVVVGMRISTKKNDGNWTIAQ